MHTGCNESLSRARLVRGSTAAPFPLDADRSSLCAVSLAAAPPHLTTSAGLASLFHQAHQPVPPGSPSLLHPSRVRPYGGLFGSRARCQPPHVMCHLARPRHPVPTPVPMSRHATSAQSSLHQAHQACFTPPSSATLVHYTTLHRARPLVSLRQARRLSHSTKLASLFHFTKPAACLTAPHERSQHTTRSRHTTARWTLALATLAFATHHALATHRALTTLHALVT